MERKRGAIGTTACEPTFKELVIGVMVRTAINRNIYVCKNI